MSSNRKSNARGAGGRSDEDIDILLKRIDEQNEQLNRLQTKFRDVTHGYKSLLAEKQALEITIKALKTKNLTPGSGSSSLLAVKSRSNTASPAVSMSDLTATSENDASSSHDEASSSAIKKVDEEASQEEKIAALTSNVQILLENKSKLEASYQAERKKFRSDYEELKVKFENFKQECQKQNDTYESRIKELKTNLKQSQTERDNLTQELNTFIKIKQTDQDNKINSLQEENLTLLANYRNENNELKFKIKNLMKQFENKCEELVQCENEYKKLKMNHVEEIKADEQELTNLRNQLKELSMSSEKRICDLEANLAQLCNTVAKYENNNNMINYLDSNSNSNQTAHKINSQNSLNKTNKLSEVDLLRDMKLNDKADLENAIEQLSQLKSYIESSARDLNIHFNFNEIWLQSNDLNVKIDKEKQNQLEKENEKLKEENRHLKEEYEKYKLRTNYLIKSAAKQQLNHGTSAADTEALSKLKDEVETLKLKCMHAKLERDADLAREREKHEQLLSNISADYKQQIEKLHTERAKTLGELEDELKKQRERTVKLLGEKETEIEQLRDLLNARKLKQLSAANKKTTPNTDESSSEGSFVATATADDEPITVTLDNHLDDSSNSSSSNYLLYYNQQLAYKDTELNKLRLGKSELEYRLKQIHDEHSVDIERLQAQIQILKEEIERCTLNQSREQLNRENLEYIKNVVFNYMTTKDPNVRVAMINAIIQILKFTKNERQKLQQLINTNKMV